MRPAMPLRTGRLTLRPLVAADAPAVFAYASQPGFFTFLDHVPLAIRQGYRPEDAEQHIRELDEMARAGWPNWAIVPHAIGKPVGAVRFHPAADASGRPELGYGLAPACWGRGWATEAAAAVLAWAAPDTPQVVARCNPANAASRRVLERLGFRPEGPDARGRLAFCWTSPKP